MTTHAERLRACLRGVLLDHAPVALWRHFPVDDQSAQRLAAAHIAFQGLYDFDLVKLTPASSFSVQDWGVQGVWEGNFEGTQTYTRRAIAEPGDWLRLKVLEPSSPSFSRQLECIRIVRSQLGPETPLLQTVFNPLAQAKHLAGQELLLEHIKSDRDMVARGLAVISESTRLFIAEVAKAGIDGIFYAVQHAQAHVMPEELFVQLSRTADVALLREAAGLWCNMVHMHGEGVYLDSVRDYPVQIMNWHDRESGPSLQDGADHWGGALCGGMSRSTIAFGSAEDVSREAVESLEGPYAERFILGTGCVIPIIAPHGNLLAARGAPESRGQGSRAQ